MSKPTAFPLDESRLPFEIPRDEPYREKIARLGQMITDRIPAKKGILTKDDPEYWGLASIVTDEMADVALKMKVRKPMTLSELVKATGKPAGELEPLLQQMAVVGLLEYNWENPRREKQYILPMFVPGSAEFFNMNKQQIADHPEVTAFFERMTFLPLEHITAMVPPGGAGIGMHVIPVEKAIETENRSADIEHISHWLKKYDGKYAAGPCSCRMSRAAMGEGCGDDPDDWCIGVGDMADYLVETDDITLRATKLAQEIREDAELHAKMLKMRTYDYVDKMLYDMQAKMDELNLKYYQSSLTISFSTFNYLDGVSKYSYNLPPYDTEWSSPSSLNFATYRNLPPGKYELHVKACNAAGIWGEENVMEIVIAPPFWKTGWAYLIYAILIAIAGYFSFRIIRNFNALRNRIAVENQLTEYKLEFFTNISHEFRTPLTLIQGALERIVNMGNHSKDMQHSLKIMDKSTKRMLRLINQLLEFRKMQKNKLALSLEETDVVAFCYEIFLSFKDVSESKNMDFRFEPSQNSYKMPVDKGNLDKVIYNLLSNAFKYTPSNGKIIFKVDVQEQKKQLCIQVIDTGLGIPKEKRAELFKRFMQSSFSHSSVGVGLHLTYGLVNIHKGTISYNENEGGGSIFTVKLPTDASVYEEKDFLVPNQLLIEEEKQRHKEFVTDENTDEQAAPPVPLNKRKVLIIEDDNDVREFLKEEISHYFEVVAEADGISGFERAQTYDADLIICDVLMPGMTGFEVTKKLKNEFATSHIPIILLTALNMEEKYLEGIESGADAYITKPFSISLLLARISKLIEQRDKLREKFSNEPGMVHAAICTNNKDSKFLAKLNEMLNEHMVETEFSVDDYANLMGLGRTVFYKKVRGVTGYSPNEYLRVIRLKKAAELLLTEDLTVSEISYKVGINDPYYFSKCFKNQFGIAPSVYQKNGGKAPASNDTAENTEQASEEKEEENETDV